MNLAPEAVQDRDLEHKRSDTSVKESAVLDSPLQLAGTMSAFAGTGSEQSNSRRVANPVLRLPANGAMRIQAMRHAQQGGGNHKTAQIVLQMKHTPLQRQCSCGGTCDACRAETGQEPEETEVVQRQSNGAEEIGDVSPIVPRAESSGQPMDRETRDYMEPRFAEDFSGVRIHTDARAAQSADALAADAYTTGREIYFAAGKYAPTSPEGKHLLAHELTHTVQQQNGEMPVAASPAGGVIVGDARDPLETEAEQVADAVTAKDSAASQISQDSAPAVRRGIRSTAKAAWNATGGRVVQGVEDLVEDSLDAVRNWLERRAPGLMAFLRGDPIEVLKEKIGKALEDSVGGLFSRIQHEGLFAVLANLASEGLEALSSLLHSVAADPCGALRKLVQGMIDFQKWMNSSLWSLLQKGASLVASLFSFLWNDLALPVWDAVKKLAGSVWSWIEARAKEFWDWIAPLRKGIAAVWNKVKQLIGAAWEKGTDVFDWLKAKLGAAWDRAKAAIQPILGPLKVIGATLLLLSPLGPVLIIGAAAYGIFQAARWLYNNWSSLEIVVKAKKILHDQIIPWIQAAVASVGNALREAAKWLLDKAHALRESLAQLAEALGVNTFLRAAKAAIDWMRGKVSAFAEWVAGGFHKLVEAVTPTLVKIKNFFQPILVVLAKLLIAVANPLLLPIYLGAVIWLILPDCIKPPLIDYILDLMIAAIRGIPNWGFFGEEWPTIKENIAKPLENIRKKGTVDEKIRFSNKVANMIAGPDLNGFSNLFEAARQAPDQFMGQVEQELVGMDLSEPLPLERRPAMGEGILGQQATAGIDAGSLAPENALLLQKSVFTDGDVQAEAVPQVAMDVDFFSSLQLGADGTVVFAENANPTITNESLRGELAAVTGRPQAVDGSPVAGANTPMQRPPADMTVDDQIRWFVANQPVAGCDTKAEPESKVPKQPASPAMQIFPPLTQGQRALFVWEQMKRGLRQWYECHKALVITSLIGALVLLVVLAVLTDGVILELLPEIMEVIGAIFIGVSVVRMSMFIADYISKAVAGDIAGAAKSLARGIAIGAIELLMYLLTAGTGKGATKAGEKAVQQGVEGAAKAGKRTARPFMEAAADAGRRFMVNIKNPVGAFVRNGKAFIRGIEQGIERGVKSLRQLGERILSKLGFRSLSAEVHASWLFIYGIFNTKVLLAEIPLPIRTRFAATLAQRPQLAEALIKLERLSRFEAVLGKDLELLGKLRELQQAAESGKTAVQFSASVARLEEEIIDELATRISKAMGPSALRDAEGLRNFIREHPERVGEFLDSAAGRIEATATSGVPAGRVDVPTHLPGIPPELYDSLRGRTPSNEIRSAVAATLVQGAADPALPGRIIVGPVHADHIVSMQKITQMRGFADLTEENMLRILNHRNNFVALSEAANTSKGALSFYDWVRYAKGGVEVDAAFRNRMILRELLLETELENEIARLLAAQTARAVLRSAVTASTPLFGRRQLALEGAGHPLDRHTREFMEPRFGAALSDVRLHTDAPAARSADALAAHAFTTGRDIYFARGKYAPDAHDGQRLLAHELTHVVQQASGRFPAGAMDQGPGDPLEQEAERMAQQVSEPTGSVAPTAANQKRSALAIASAPAVQRLLTELPAIVTEVLPAEPAAGQGATTTLVPQGEPAVTIDDIAVYDDPAYMRHRLEQLVVDKGYGTFRTFVAHFQISSALVGGTVEANDRIRPMIESVAKAIEDARSQFVVDFQTMAVSTARETLDRSEAEEKLEADRYGIRWETVVSQKSDCMIGSCKDVRTTFSMGDRTAMLTGLQAAAQVLLDRRRELDEAMAQLERDSAGAGEGAGAEVGSLTVEQRKKVQDKKDAYDLMRGYIVRDYPILAPMSDRDENIRDLQNVADQTVGADLAALLGAEIVERLTNVSKVRDGLEDGDINIWRLPDLVHVTSVKMGVETDPLKSRGVEDQVKAEKPSWLESLALLVLNIVALVLAAPTGGASLAVAAGANAGVAVKHIHEYMMQKALTGTAFDKAQALSQEDPSLFWLAVEVVGAAVDVSAAFKTVSAAVKAVEIAQETGDAVRVAEDLEKLQRVAKANGGEKLAAEVAAHFGQGGTANSSVLKALGATSKEEAALQAGARAAKRELEAGTIVAEALAKGPVKISTAGHIYTCRGECKYLLEEYKDLLGPEIKQAGESATLRSQYLELEKRAAAIAEEVKKAEAARALGKAQPGEMESAQKAAQSLEHDIAEFEAKLASRKTAEREVAEAASPDHVTFEDEVTGELHEGVITDHGLEICSPRPCPIVSAQIKAAADKIRSDLTNLHGAIAPQVESELARLEQEAREIDSLTKTLYQDREAHKLQIGEWEKANPGKGLPDDLARAKIDLKSRAAEINGGRRNLRLRMAKLPGTIPIRDAVRKAAGPQLAKLGLSEEAMERVFAKAPSGDHMMGQLLEELLNIEVAKKVKVAAEGGAGLAEGERVFVAGERISLGGRKFSDGIILTRRNGVIYVTRIYEAKGGSMAAEGLSATRPAGSLDALSGPDFRSLRGEAIEELRSKRYPEMGIDEIWEQHEPEVRRYMDTQMPHTEEGQIRRDIERLVPNEDQLTTTIKIDGVPIEVVSSPQRTVLTGVTARGVTVDPQAVKAMRDAGLKLTPHQLAVEQKDLQSLATLMENAAAGALPKTPQPAATTAIVE